MLSASLPAWTSSAYSFLEEPLSLGTSRNKNPPFPLSPEIPTRPQPPSQFSDCALSGAPPEPQGRATLLGKRHPPLLLGKVCGLICPPGGARTPAAPLTLKPSTAPSAMLIMHLQADPSLASHFLPSGYSATPPPPSASQLPPSPSASLLPTTTSPTPSLPPSASRASGAPGEPLILCLSPQDPGQSERGPQLRLGTHTPPVSFLPLPIRTCQERVYQEAVLELLTWRGQWA